MANFMFILPQFTKINNVIYKKTIEFHILMGKLYSM